MPEGVVSLSLVFGSLLRPTLWSINDGAAQTIWRPMVGFRQNAKLLLHHWWTLWYGFYLLTIAAHISLALNSSFFFETGAMSTPIKSQITTNCG